MQALSVAGVSRETPKFYSDKIIKERHVGGHLRICDLLMGFSDEEALHNDASARMGDGCMDVEAVHSESPYTWSDDDNDVHVSLFNVSRPTIRPHYK